MTTKQAKRLIGHTVKVHNNYFDETFTLTVKSVESGKGKITKIHSINGGVFYASELTVITDKD